MDVAFACPECGNTLELTGYTPGREILCEWCRTWVEVPYLPRASQPKRGRLDPRRRRSGVTWAWAGAGLLAVLIVLTGTNRMLRTRSRSAHEKAMVELVASAEADANAGRLDRALVEIEGALIEAGKIEPPDTARLAELRRQRDLLARREAEAQLAALAVLDPGAAVGAARTLLARVRNDPVLNGLEGTIEARLDQARRLSVEADLTAARQTLANQPAQMLALCERLAGTADELEENLRDRSLAEAESLVARVITQQGVVIEPIRGRFTLGTARDYASALDLLLADSLRQHGYLLRPASTRWDALWDKLAPFRASVVVTESQPSNYQASLNRLSYIEVKLALSRNGTPIWQRLVVGHSRESLPKLRAYQASRVAVSDRRSADFERLLYNDARVQVIEKAAPVVRTLPAHAPATGGMTDARSRFP